MCKVVLFESQKLMSVQQRAAIPSGSKKQINFFVCLTAATAALAGLLFRFLKPTDASVWTLTMIGTVSTGGGNLEELVTQSTLATVKDFLGLYERAYKRFYPAVDPPRRGSWSLTQLNVV